MGKSATEPQIWGQDLFEEEEETALDAEELRCAVFLASLGGARAGVRVLRRLEAEHALSPAQAQLLSRVERAESWQHALELSLLPKEKTLLLLVSLVEAGYLETCEAGPSRR